MSSQQPTPNDQRSNVKNPNNPTHEADRINREKQQQENNSGGQKPAPAPTPKK